jgi:magnesium-transporting ATPase (P-type)
VARLRLAGLDGVGDPIREGADAVARALELAGIRLVLITGDHPATATAIAGKLSIFHEGDLTVRGDQDDLAGSQQVAGVAWAPLRALLDTQPLTAAQLAGCAAVATLPGAGLIVTRAVGRAAARRRGPRSSPTGTSGPATAPVDGGKVESTREA